MTTMFRIIALSSLDPDGRDVRDEPELPFPEALEAARNLKFQGKAFRVFSIGDQTDDQRQAFSELGAVS